MASLDQGTLTILERLDSLEALLLSPGRVNIDASPATSSTTRHHIDRQSQNVLSPVNFSSPVILEESDSFGHSITIESVLSWPVWSGRFDSHLNLKQLLLNPPEGGSTTDYKKINPDREIIGEEQLVRNYFQTFHIFNPVLDERKISQYRLDAQRRGYAWDAQSCLLLLIFAIGNIAESETYWEKAARSVDWKRSAAFENAESCFVSAQKRFGVVMAKAGVLEAQCLFLAGVYLMTTLRPLEAWRMFVQAVACCQTFHPFGDEGPTNPLDAKLERSVQDSIYWTCFKSELELRLELHVSELALRDFKYPPFFPSPPKDLLPTGEAAWYFYLAEIALQRLRGRILYHAYKCQITGLTVHDMIDMVLNFEQQAREWMSSLPPIMALDRSPPVDEAGRIAEQDSFRLILRGHLLDCFEVMYWPFLKEISNHDFNAAGQQPSPTVFSFAQKGLDVCIDRIEQTEAGFRSRHHGTWLTLRSSTRSAFVLLAFRQRQAQASDLGKYLRLPSTLTWAVNKVIDLLRFWQFEIGDAHDRLRLLEDLMIHDAK